MQARRASEVAFALTIIAMGVIGLVSGDFAAIWRPVSSTFPARDLLVYGCAIISLATGAGLLWKSTRRTAALTLLLFLLIWTALFKLKFIISQPLVEVSYQTCGENAVLIAASWALYVFSRSSDPASSWTARGGGLRTAHVLYGLALLAFGLSHFFYLNLTAPLVPAWLPAHVFWAFFTGAIYLVTGILLVSGFHARIGAAIAAVQITLITVLVWGPMLLSGQMTAMHSQETVESWALTAGAWALATSFVRSASGSLPDREPRHPPSR